MCVSASHLRWLKATNLIKWFHKYLKKLKLKKKTIRMQHLAIWCFFLEILFHVSLAMKATYIRRFQRKNTTVKARKQQFYCQHMNKRQIKYKWLDKQFTGIRRGIQFTEYGEVTLARSLLPSATASHETSYDTWGRPPWYARYWWPRSGCRSPPVSPPRPHTLQEGV